MLTATQVPSEKKLRQRHHSAPSTLDDVVTRRILDMRRDMGSEGDDDDDDDDGYDSGDADQF